MSEKVLMTPAELEQRLGKPDIVVIDARGPDAYAAGHIPGAVNVHDIFSFRTPEGRTEVTAAFALPARNLTAASSADGVEYAVRLSVIVVDTLLDVVTRLDTMQRITRPRALGADAARVLATVIAANDVPSAQVVKVEAPGGGDSDRVRCLSGRRLRRRTAQRCPPLSHRL